MTVENSSRVMGAVTPNLFIIGAQKSGTTSLHSYLGAHPDVFMSSTKEPGYFVPEMDYYPKDLEWYLSLFAGAGGTKVVGESSTHYTKRPFFEGVAERIYAFAPNARFVYVMRDPIRRAISHYWHNKRNFEEHRPILEAMRDAPVYRDFGDYEFQLHPYVEVFGLDRIHVVLFERLAATPQLCVNSLLSWLGLSDMPPDAGFAPENRMPLAMKEVRGRGRLQGLRHHPLWETMSPHVPNLVKDLGKGLALRSIEAPQELDEAVVDLLRPWAQASILRLSALLGREFPEWTTSLGAEG